jgi:hypothetical protein
MNPLSSLTYYRRHKRQTLLLVGIHTGDRIDRTVSRDWTGESWYDAIPAPLELVGILEGTGSGSSIRMGFVH